MHSREELAAAFAHVRAAIDSGLRPGEATRPHALWRAEAPILDVGQVQHVRSPEGGLRLGNVTLVEIRRGSGRS